MILAKYSYFNHIMLYDFKQDFHMYKVLMWWNLQIAVIEFNSSLTCDFKFIVYLI